MVRVKKSVSQTVATPPSPPQSAADEDKVTLVTREGLEKLKEELAYLKDVRRKEIAERIREAISYGDLSENSEYEEAKNEQAFLEGRIFELEEKIKHVKIIDDRHKQSVVVQIGSKVVIRQLSGKAKKDEMFTIVGSTEADPLDQKISNESPVGKALLERRAGEIIKVSTPAGAMQYKIVKID